MPFKIPLNQNKEIIKVKELARKNWEQSFLVAHSFYFIYLFRFVLKICTPRIG